MNRATSRIVPAVLLAALVAASAVTAPAALAAPGDLAFIRFKPSMTGVKTSIVTMEPTGKKQRVVLQHTISKGSATKFLASADMSSDGERIVFAQGFALASSSAIWTANANGKGRKRIVKLAGNKRVFSPSWSADGKKIVYVETDGSSYAALVTAKANGKNRKEIDRNTHWYQIQPTWSPDGKRILFSTRSVSDGPLRVASVKAGGGGLTWLTKPGKGNCVAGDWSPDGKRIAFTCRPYEGPVERAAGPFAAGAGLGSPRGIGGTPGFDVYTAKTNGKGVKRISNDGRAIGRVVYTADGQRLITSRSKSQSVDLYSRSVKGTGPWKRLTKTKEALNTFDYIGLSLSGSS